MHDMGGVFHQVTAELGNGKYGFQHGFEPSNLSCQNPSFSISLLSPPPCNLQIQDALYRAAAASRAPVCTPGNTVVCLPCSICLVCRLTSLSEAHCHISPFIQPPPSGQCPHIPSGERLLPSSLAPQLKSSAAPPHQLVLLLANRQWWL